MPPRGSRIDRSPVAELIARRLNEQRFLGRQAITAFLLSANVILDDARRLPFEVILALQPFQTLRIAESAGQLAKETPDGDAEIVTTADLLAAPEGDHGGGPLGGGDDDTIHLPHARLHALLAGEPGDPGLLEPIYVRAPDAEGGAA